MCSIIATSVLSLLERTFNIAKTTIFILSFCIGLITKLNDSALGILKRHYIAKIICELLIVNSKFETQNLSDRLLCYTDIKESLPF